MDTAAAIAAWVATELAGAAFGDARLARRFRLIVSTLAAHPALSVPAACNGDWAATKATYRFWDHAAVTPARLRAPHAAATRARVATYPVVLAVQDTTNLNFSAHPQTTGLGYLDRPKARGLLLHSVLAVSVEGLPLGLLDQVTWARDPATRGKAATRRARPIAEKESNRWLAGLRVAQTSVPATTTVVTVADREADIFELFAEPRPAHSHLLIRAAHNRALGGQAGYIWETMRAAPRAGVQVVEVPRHPGQPARQAVLEVRYATLTIQPPRHHAPGVQLTPLSVQVVLAEEAHPPADAERVSWLLLTTLPVRSRAEAERCVRWYSHRWVIERFHLVLKSGCGVEGLELATAARLERAVATKSIVAWRLLWLTLAARADGEQPASAVLSGSEWAALCSAISGQAETPGTPPTLRQAVRWIAKLGGFLGRKGDGEPGVQTLWRGWRRLQDLVALWDILHPPPPS